MIEPSVKHADFTDLSELDFQRLTRVATRINKLIRRIAKDHPKADFAKKQPPAACSTFVKLWHEQCSRPINTMRLSKLSDVDLLTIVGSFINGDEIPESFLRPKKPNRRAS